MESKFEFVFKLLPILTNAGLTRLRLCLDFLMSMISWAKRISATKCKLRFHVLLILHRSAFLWACLTFKCIAHFPIKLLLQFRPLSQQFLQHRFPSFFTFFIAILIILLFVLFFFLLLSVSVSLLITILIILPFKMLVLIIRLF